MPRDFDQQMQLKMIAMQSRAASRAMQHEIAAMAQAQTRLAAMQTRIAHLSCRGSQQSNWSNNVVQVHSRGNRVDVDLDMDRLSREIDEEVSRSMANSVRNF